MSPTRVGFLREQKDALLQYLIRCDADATRPLGSTSLPPSDTNAAPLAPAQEALLLSERLGGSTAYSMPAMLVLTGTLDIEALQHSLNDLRARHSSLRSRIAETSTGPQQIADVPADTTLEIHDFTARYPDTDDTAIDAFVAQWAQIPFAITTGPLLRTLLLAIGPREHRLLLNLHHAIADGWSMSVFATDLSERYRAHVLRTPARLAPLRRDYLDYAHWQNARAEKQSWAHHLPYWRETLHNAPERLTLPHDHSRPTVRSFNGAEVPLQIRADVTQHLKTLAATWRVTPFIPLLAAFHIVLSRWAQQDDVIVGVPAANRRQEDTESMIGLFVDMLPIRASIDDTQTFEGLVSVLKSRLNDATAHADVPFSELLSVSGVARDSAAPALVPAVLVFDNTPNVVLSLPDLQVRQQRLTTTTSKFDLTLFIQDDVDGFAGYLEYATDLFERETMQRFVDSFRTLLEDAIARPEARCHSLALVPPDDLDRLLYHRHGAVLPFDTTARMHDLIHAQAQHHPSRIAIRTDEGTLTYGALEQRATILARALQARGVGPETVVGVCLSRTPTLIVTLLAILKAGGAYLPLDAAYPQARLALMVEDCHALFTLTETRFADTLAGTGTLLTLNALCTFDGIDESHDAPPVTCDATSSNLAYIIYTSGSTGRPKGVSITHRNVLALHTWAVDEYRDNELSNVIASTSICFDISIFEIFVPLMSGGSVTLAQSALSLPSVAQGARILNTVPSAVAELVNRHAVPDSVDVVNVAGEPLSHRLVADIYANTRAKRVYNLYGPSEDTTYSTFARVAPHTDPVPVGRPLPNTQLYVLDRHRQLLPSGVVGELYIGGSGLARGYFDRAALTDERFISHPLAGTGRLYRTGDLVRFGHDGELYCLGRCDQQIKIRGFRIEIGEIEAALHGCAAVENAVVVAREMPTGERFLVAYVKPATPSAVDLDADVLITSLRGQLRSALIEAMIPSMFILLAELPLLPNGKIDKAALPIPGHPGQQANNDNSRPSTYEETVIAEIWSSLLGVSDPGIHTDFFELGGHSLKAARMRHMIEQRLNVELPLTALFRGATIANLAGLVAELGAEPLPERPLAATPDHAGGADTDKENVAASVLRQSPAASTVRLMRQGQSTDKEAMFLFHPAGGHLFGYAALLRYLAFDGPIYGVQRPDFDGPQAASLLSTSDLAKRYISDIRRTQARGPYRLLGWSFGGLMASLVGQRLRQDGDEVIYVGAIDTRLPPPLTPAEHAALAECDGIRVADAKGVLPDALLTRVHTMARGDLAIQASAADDLALRDRLIDLYLADLWALALHVGHDGGADEILTADMRLSTLPAVTHAYDASQTSVSSSPASEHTDAAGVVTRVYNGDHFAILQASAAKTMAQWIARDSSDAQHRTANAYRPLQETSSEAAYMSLPS
jgi:amino acid adenylation domain-containing protein